MKIGNIVISFKLKSLKILLGIILWFPALILAGFLLMLIIDIVAVLILTFFYWITERFK